MKAIVPTPFENVVVEFEHLESINWLRKEALWLGVFPMPDAPFDDPVRVQYEKEVAFAKELRDTGNYA
jgi:hypothetical protein